MTASRPAALIVEDQPFVGLVAADVLRESGFQAFHAFDAKDAAEVLAHHPEIDVMVTDADLPGGIDGLELCRRVSQVRPGVRLIVTAARPDLHQLEVPKGTCLLRKPYASDELSALVGPRSLLEES